MSRRGRRKPRQRPSLPIGATAVAGDTTLRSFRVGALPLLDHFFQRLELPKLLARHLPEDDVRQEVPTARIALLLVRNVLLARQPMYAVREWAAGYAPEWLDLFHVDCDRLHDDRLGRCLARLYSASTPNLILAIVRQAIEAFGVSLDEMHNDSTTVAFHGDYKSAPEAWCSAAANDPIITWGHSKDRRPDLKQLLFTLTVTNDGGVPVYFSVNSGNTNDDTTHCATWDLLAELVGGPTFLYVADCKLASRKNLHHIAARGGRFVTVLPASRREDHEFRKRLRDPKQSVPWKDCWKRLDDAQLRDTDEPPRVVDVIRVCAQEQVTSDGFRLLWFHSTRKAELDELSRSQRVQRAIQDLEKLHRRLTSPRTRFREHLQVQEALDVILTNRKVQRLMHVEIVETRQAEFRQQSRGRPSAKTKYRREVSSRFELRWQIDEDAWRTDQLEDGVYPLLTNDRSLTPREVLEAYKRQPKIEKRFAQLKSDFNIAPVFLRPERVLGLFTVYFLALLVQSLIERELRNSLAEAERNQPDRSDGDPAAIAIYPEERRTRRPTARRVIDALEPLRRYEIHRKQDGPRQEPLELYDTLTERQVGLLRLLGIDPKSYGR